MLEALFAMIINPVFILFFVYFSANIYAFSNAIRHKGFEVYGYFYDASIWELSFVFLLQSIFLIGLFTFFKINLNRCKCVSNQAENGAGYFLLTITVAFFAFSQYYGAGIAGSDFKFEDANFLNYIFVLLQPDVWFFLIAPYLRSKKLFWICSVLFLVSLISRGWMGGIMLIGVVFFIRNYPVKIKINRIVPFAFVFLSIVALLPVFDAFKWGMRLGMSFGNVVNSIIEMDYLYIFKIVLQSVIDRFHNIYYVVYALQDRSNIISEIFNGNVNWFFQGGILNSAYCKIGNCGKDIGIYLAESISRQSNISWNVDVGISGWTIVLGWGFFVYILFSALLLNFGYRIFIKKFGLKGVMLFGAFSFIYFFHGWNNAFFNLIIYALFYQLLTRLKFKIFSADGWRS